MQTNLGEKPNNDSKYVFLRGESIMKQWNVFKQTFGISLDDDKTYKITVEKVD